MAVLIMVSAVACNNSSKVVAPIEVPNLDSLKTYVDKAVQTNDPKDQYFAARYYLEQYNASDSAKAMDLLLKSAAQDFPWAAMNLGNIYSADSTNSYYDLKKAVEYYELGVKNGSDRAMTNLANLYMDGKGVETDYKKALQLRTDATLGLLALAEAGDAAAQERLGANLISGIGLSANKKIGLKWIRKSADQGFTSAISWLGWYYESGEGGLTKNPKEAFVYYEKAAEKGEAYALLKVARCYANGIGVESNLEKAFEYYLKAAELGDKDAMFNTALSYQQGHGTEKNYKEAFNWYKKCAERGNTLAMNNIGAMYDSGQGVAKNEKEAFKWFMKAAEKGEPWSQRVIGDFYSDGKGVEADKTKAFEWYKKAADNGDKTAMNRLARCYFLGEGVPKDEDLMYYWLHQSQQ